MGILGPKPTLSAAVCEVILRLNQLKGSIGMLRPRLLTRLVGLVLFSLLPLLRGVNAFGKQPFGLIEF